MIEHQLGNIRLKDFTPELIESWGRDLTAAGKSPATIAKASHLVALILAKAVRRRRIAVSRSDFDRFELRARNIIRG